MAIFGKNSWKLTLRLKECSLDGTRLHEREQKVERSCPKTLVAIGTATY